MAGTRGRSGSPAAEPDGLNADGSSADGSSADGSSADGLSATELSEIRTRLRGELAELRLEYDTSVAALNDLRQDSTGRDSTGRDSTGKDSTGKVGAGKDGAGKDEAGGADEAWAGEGGAGGSGTSLTAKERAAHASLAFEREREQSIVASRGLLLSQLEHAIERIDSGTYGSCENCGRPIPVARLKALPMATLDAGCATRAARG